MERQGDEYQDHCQPDIHECADCLKLGSFVHQACISALLRASEQLWTAGEMWGTEFSSGANERRIEVLFGNLFSRWAREATEKKG